MKPSDDLIVSSTEPTGGDRKRVWIQKGENLLDANSLFAGNRIATDGSLYPDADYSASNLIPVNPNTNYIVNWMLETKECVSYYDENKAFISRNVSTNPFTTPKNCKWIRVSLLTTKRTTARLEQGLTVTQYEAYIEPKIYLKNNNDVYEEFMKKENVVDFESQVTFNEILEIAQFKKIGGIVTINYVGENKTHSQNTLLFTIPEKYAPRLELYFSFIKSDGTYGVVKMNPNGTVYINQIMSTTVSGKIYLNFIYITD